VNRIRARKDFKCVVCQRPDYCTYFPDAKGWVCMRIQNNHPTKNGGWWHADNGEHPKPVPKPQPEPPQIDAAALMQEWAASTPLDYVERFATELGVTTDSLAEVGTAWARPHHAFGFPMFNGEGRMTGIRLRDMLGRKRCVTGSREGLFIPWTTPPHAAYIVEGPTDLAALLTLGAWGIGRPTCRGCIAHLQVTINRLRIQRVIVIGDNDISKWEGQVSPGIDGAKKLAVELQVPVASLLLPAKDTREFVKQGGTRQLLEALCRNLVWRQPR
jgi:hypothetical protein